MRVRGVALGVLVAALRRYGVRRARGGRSFLASMINPVDGRIEFSPDERRRALVVDAMFRKLGVRCLWRAAVLTDLLRDEGVAAHVTLSVGGNGSTLAHAEVSIGDVTLRPHPGGALLR